MSKNKKGVGLGMYTPLLVILLLVAVFFVGRLSSQVEMMGGSVVVKEEMVDGEVQGEVGEEGSPIGVANLKQMADDLGLNQGDFDSCLDGGKFEQRIKDDLAYGAELGVSGTPTFFINGIILVGAQPVDEFEKVIDAELAGEKGAKVDRRDVGDMVGAVKGGEGATVKVVEFSDFECPYCTRTIPVIEGLFEKYGDKISLEYRHYPLGFHTNAQKAAEASECAGEQGKFWEMHDVIFQAQG